MSATLQPIASQLQYIATFLLHSQELYYGVIVTAQSLPQTCPHQLQDESGSK